MSKSTAALIALAATIRTAALRGADSHFVEQGRTAAALLNALRGANPWLIAAVAVLTEESLPGRGYDRQRGATARGLLGGELTWSGARVPGTNGRVKITRSLDRFWVLLDGAAALEGWWYHSTDTRTPAQRAAERAARRAKTTAAAAAYTAARLEVEQALRCLSPVQRGHWARFCSHYTGEKPAPVGGWEAYYGQAGGTVGKAGLPTVAAQGALRRASKAAGTSIEADIAAFEAVEARRKAEEARKITRLFRELADAVWTARCLAREAAALESVSRLRAVHA
jgi:hypothetical protein